MRYPTKLTNYNLKGQQTQTKNQDSRQINEILNHRNDQYTQDSNMGYFQNSNKHCKNQANQHPNTSNLNENSSLLNQSIYIQFQDNNEIAMKNNELQIDLNNQSYNNLSKQNSTILKQSSEYLKNQDEPTDLINTINDKQQHLISNDIIDQNFNQSFKKDVNKIQLNFDNFDNMIQTSTNQNEQSIDKKIMNNTDISSSKQSDKEDYQYLYLHKELIDAYYDFKNNLYTNKKYLNKQCKILSKILIRSELINMRQSTSISKQEAELTTEFLMINELLQEKNQKRLLTQDEAKKLYQKFSIKRSQFKDFDRIKQLRKELDCKFIFKNIDSFQQAIQYSYELY